jgi:hypothetical protein
MAKKAESIGGTRPQPFDYTENAEREVTRFWKEEQRTIILLTVKELLGGNFAHKLT